MGFSLLFLVFFINGVFCAFYPKKAIFLFILLSVLIPTSSAFTNLTYSSGFFVIDAFFLALTIIMLIRIAILRKVHINIREILFFSLPIFIFTLYFLFSVLNHSFNLKILKEIRPILLLIETIVFIIFIRQVDFKVSFKTISKLAIIAAISNLFYFLILFFKIIVPSDIYYINNTYRYLDLSTYFSIYFIIHYFIIKENKFFTKSFYQSIALYFSFVTIIVANSRFLILALFIALIFSNISNYKLLIKRIFLGLIVVFLFIGVSYFLRAERVLNALSTDAIVMQLSNRYLPAILDIYKMTDIQKVFGYGLGHYFEIPWFDYRQNIENQNISVDCAYLTVYVKQGLLGILSLILTTYLLVSVKGVRHKVALIIFWGSMFIVSSSFYQIYPLGAVIYNAFLSTNEIT